MKIIQITDIHLMPADETLFDNDPGARLAACLSDIRRNHPDADLCVITGDLAHHGQEQSYVRLRQALEGFPVPVRLLIGNHDDRTQFRRVFPDIEVDEHGFVQSVLDNEEGCFLFLDTNRADSHAGRYCADRLAWLDARLKEAAGRPVYLFMHHHPLPVHFRPVDELILEDGLVLGRLLEGHDVRHIFFGHVHRPICGSWNGIPFSTLRGLNHQTWLDFALERGIPCSMEPPAYAIVFIEGGSVVVHSHDFLDDSAKYHYDPDLPVDRQVVALT
ncbi:phosphodiesterase [Rhizobium puerariae]|uniref:Phosphodiesterase n=1 Tax=Rhizobium puerariae TaxID=1585791 RepID=A0ABV6AAA0_9HYPH